MYRSCRFREELSNNLFFKLDPNPTNIYYLLGKIGVDTAENEPSEVWPACLPRTTTHSPTLLGRRKSQANVADKVQVIRQGIELLL